MQEHKKNYSEIKANLLLLLREEFVPCVFCIVCLYKSRHTHAQSYILFYIFCIKEDEYLIPPWERWNILKTLKTTILLSHIKDKVDVQQGQSTYFPNTTLNQRAVYSIVNNFIVK